MLVLAQKASHTHTHTHMSSLFMPLDTVVLKIKYNLQMLKQVTEMSDAMFHPKPFKGP